MGTENACEARTALARSLCEIKCEDSERYALVLGILSGYEIKRRETSIIAYQGDETDRLIRNFCIAKRVAGCTERTCKTYYNSLMIIFSRIKKAPDKVDHTDVQSYMASRIIAGDKKTTQQGTRRFLSTFYAWLTKEEIILKNPMLKVDTVKCKPPKKRAFSEMEIERIRAACKTKRESALVELLLSTGLRIFEAAKLLRKDVLTEEINIIGKGEKPRTVYLNAKAQLALSAYLQERSDKNPYLFPMSIFSPQHNCGWHSRGPQGLWYKNPKNVAENGHSDTSVLESIVRRIGKNANVEDVHPHRFRRTCATLALRRGMPLILVQQMLGHEQLSTTQRYLDTSDEDLRQAHKRYVI